MLSAVYVSSSSKLRLLLSYLIIVAASSSSTSSSSTSSKSSISSMLACRSKISSITSTTRRFPLSNHSLRSSLLPPSAAAFISPSRGRTFTSQTTRHHSSATRVYQSKMGFANNEEPPNSNNNADDETSKWTSLYNNYQPQSSPILPTPPPSSTTLPLTTTTLSSEIKIITFDLDNTLWKTSETITHANTCLFELLHSKFGIEIRSEVMMGKLFRELPNRYCGLLDDDDDGEGDGDGNGNGGVVGSDVEYANSVQNVGRTETIINSSSPPAKEDDGVHIQTKKKKKPVYLTLLRKDAIRSLILQQQQQQPSIPLSPIELETEVDTAFNVWMEARTQSISQNFAPFALETLSQLKSSLVQPQQSKKKKVYIGAITDGNSNPQSVPELSGLFDFVIKAEDVGVSKPDKRVYKAAVAELMLQLIRDGLSVEEFFLGEQHSGGSGGVGGSYLMSNDSGMQQQSPSWKDIDPDAVEAFSEAVGPWWVHIGDDFFKDIVAAKEFRMRSVWVRELIGGANAFGGGGEATAADSTTKRSVEDLVNDIAKNNGAITMSIGDSDFLTSALHEEFSDAILDRFADLSDLLIQWNEEGSGNEGAYDSEAVNIPNTETVISEAYSVTMPSVAPPPPQNDESERGSTKFCFACGEKIPAVAKFCPGCGERQS
ncbi:HAD-like hydrolase superfamily phosphatase [Skeletonema marinoi]|uniref:HAD-like hydrolase superfamily phosphatase n=1 Tax=Skeletonema marinoi TaxID=267567 RepID=A0AAD8YEF5_9STRA|nr:HAD-like hydrolase superfamily phosphatase [Skeletonema marinoi]